MDLLRGRQTIMLALFLFLTGFILGLVCRRSGSAHESSLSRYCMGSYCFERYEILADTQDDYYNIFILGVTHASLQNWEYMEIIREAADPKCSDHLVNSISTIDNILSNSPSFLKRQLKNLFGLGDLEHDEDFASVLEVSYLSYTICLAF